jgi:hypothetical protein
MADVKISGLPASTTPLAGTEVLPVVQSGVTKKVSVANLTAGRAISATQLTLSTGSLIVASGQGVDFSATAGTGTSELLNDYEEGTWTPAYTADGGNPTVTYTTQSGTYTKVGRVVTITCTLLINTVSGGSGVLRVANLPFTSGATCGLSNAFVFNFINNPQQYNVTTGLSSITLYQSTFTNTGSTAADLQPSAFLYISGSYIV